MQPTSNPGTTGKSGAAAASPFAVGAGLTGAASTGGTTTTKKRGNGLFGVRSSNKEVPKTTPPGQPTTTEVVADGPPEKAMSTGGVVPAQKSSDVYDSEGTHRRGLFGTGTGTGAFKHHLHSGTTSGAFSSKFSGPTCGDVHLGYVAVQEPHLVGRIVDLPKDAKDVELITHELNRMPFPLGRFLSRVLFF